MKQVLILDANQRCALATVRSLGKRGICVFTADESSTALAGCSRFSSKYFQYPDPIIAPEQFVNFIRSLTIAHDIQIILPMTELTITLLLQNRHYFQKVVIPAPDLATVDTLADKSSLMRLAESINVSIPKTCFVDNPDNLPVSLTKLSYPLVLKPSKSWMAQDKKWVHTNVRFANNLQQAESILKTDSAFRAPYMLQERVVGTGQGIFALYDKGKAIAFFSHRRLREKPPWGGG